MYLWVANFSDTPKKVPSLVVWFAEVFGIDVFFQTQDLRRNHEQKKRENLVKRRRKNLRNERNPRVFRDKISYECSRMLPLKVTSVGLIIVGKLGIYSVCAFFGALVI